MPNLRVISDNAAERATVTSSDTAANFDPATLKTSRKSDVWRSAAVTARLTAAWATLESLQAVVLPFCNLSPTATMRVRVSNEPAVTNMLRYSEQADNAVYTKTGCTIIPDAIAAPDGTMTADKIVEDTSAAGHSILQSVAVAANSWYAWSRFYKAGERTFAFASVGNFAAQATTASVYLNLLTGAVSGTGATRATVTAYPNGWWRLTITVQTGAAAATINPGSYISLTGASQNYTGDGTSGIYVWGGQFEAIASSNLPATSYYPTVASALTRPAGYIDSWQTYAYDSGAQLACPAPAARLRGFTAAQAANAYAFGGGAAARLWMPASVSAYGLAVDIVDTANLQGYLESSFLVTGPYWESATNFDYGASAQLGDSSTSTSNDAGDLITDAGTMNKKLSIPMSKLSLVDQEALWNIFQSCGSRYPAYVSMFAGSTNLPLEARHQTYGKFLQIPAMALPFFNVASATIEVQSI